MTVLDIDTVDLGEVAIGGTVIGDDWMRSGALSMIQNLSARGYSCAYTE